MTDPNKPDDQTPSDEPSATQSHNASDPQSVSEQGVSENDAADAAFDQAGAAPDSGEEADPWAAAMAEQQAAEQQEPAEDDSTAQQAPQPQAREASSDVFPPLGGEQTSDTSRDLEMIMDIPVKLTVELGRTRLTIKQLLELAQGSVVELDGLAGEPMDILINGYLIAQGEVVVIEDKYGIRITEIITPSERIHKLNR